MVRDALSRGADRHTTAAADGSLVPLADQDRRLWNREAIDEGVALITDALSRPSPGAYQLQAAIAAVHDEAPTAEATDWAQIVLLYDLLARVADNPMARLNHAIAVAMAQGPLAGLHLLDSLLADERVAGHHRLFAARAHLLEMVGDIQCARTAYQAAARGTASVPEKRYLQTRIARLGRHL